MGKGQEEQSIAEKKNGKQVVGGGESTSHELGKKRWWRIREMVMNGRKTNRRTKQEREEGGKLGEQTGFAYPYGGVLGGCDKCLAILAELAVQHRLCVPQQSG